jgi:hypothetical protein
MSDTDTRIPKIDLNEPAWSPDETRTPGVRLESTPALTRRIVLETRSAKAPAPVIDIDRLYEAVPGTSSQIVSALELLKQASDNLAAALKCDSAIEADRFVQRVQLMLPKLFAYRSIGDGFGVVINSIYFALTNLHGTPLTRGQINVVWRVLRELRPRPAMPVEQGIQLAGELEAHGLEVDPPELADLLEESESAEDE